MLRMLIRQWNMFVRSVIEMSREGYVARTDVDVGM